MEAIAAKKRLYRGIDPREVASYALGEAARYLHIPVATLRS
jgi:hypothetical protein